jgi:hypothetical protein
MGRISLLSRISTTFYTPQGRCTRALWVCPARNLFFSSLLGLCSLSFPPDWPIVHLYGFRATTAQ